MKNIIFLTSALLLGAANATQLPLCDLTFDHKTTIKQVPLAQTPADRAKGLSGIKDVGVGMLFYFQKPDKLAFWMHNTHVPLSIGFIDAKGVLFQIEDMQPDTDVTHFSTQDAKYALELPKGDFKRRGLNIGAKDFKLVCASQLAQDVLRKINQYRAQQGLSALVMDPLLSKIAQQHSQNLASHKLPFGHGGFAKRSKQMQAAFPKFAGAAENIAYRYPTASIVVNGWIHSPGHRRNILGNYQLTGIGIVYDKQGHPWYTQVFLKTFL